MTPEQEKEASLIEYYETHIKKLKPTLTIDADGKPVVKGLESLKK
jgi:hypothetical protein